MGFQQFILAFMSAGLLFFALYYLFATIVVYKKRDKHFYFFLASLFSACYCIFELLLSIEFTDIQYMIFHKMKIVSLMLCQAFWIKTMYELYFSSAKKIIANISILIIPFIVIITPFNIFTSLPIKSIEINTFLSDFNYTFGKTNVGYTFFSVLLMISLLSSSIYFIFSKLKDKRIQFLIIIASGVLAGINDFAVSHGFIKNILVTEYVLFLALGFIFVEFLFEDRKIHLSVIEFAKDLENKVEERTRELKVEKEKTESLLKKTDFLLKRSDNLLLNVLPESIATRLKEGETTIADHFEEASVVFIDIVDFTKLSTLLKPQEVVKILNDIFTIFDKIAAKFGLEKIKTIGDCYMAASGIPIPRQDHSIAIAMMAIEVIETMKGYITEGGHEIQFRIGIDCGPIVAGVIGTQKFIYDLWGDMVNTASRMETNGVNGKVQCTDRFKEKLIQQKGQLSVKFEERGEIEIKGKGLMKTFFLNANS